MISNKKNILFVVHSFIKNWAAGVENYTFSLAKELERKNFKITFLYPTLNENAKPTLIHGKYENFDVYQITNKNKLPLFNEVQTEELDKIFTEFFTKHKFDIVHFHHFMGFPLSFAEIAHKFGAKIFISLHDFWLICPRVHLFIEETDSICRNVPSPYTCAKCLLNGDTTKNEFYFLSTFLRKRNELVKKIFNLAELVVAPSEFVKKKYGNVNSYKEIKVIPLGLPDIKEQLPPKDKTQITFGYIGSIAPVKNIYNLVETFKKTKGEKLLIYGNGASHELEKLMRKISDDKRIDYKGSYLPSELQEVLSKMDVVIIPSYIETFSFTVREALLANKFVIAANVGGIPEVILHKYNGLLFSPYDNNSLSDAINYVIANPSLIDRKRTKKKNIVTIREDAEIWSRIYIDKIYYPKVSIIIPVYNKLSLTKNCINSIYENTLYPNFEVIVVDNGSTDGTKEYLEKQSQERRNFKAIINEKNLGFSAANNLAVRKAEGELVHFLNNDTKVSKYWLCSLVEIMREDKTVHAVGSKLLFPDKTLQHLGVIILEKQKEILPIHFFYKLPNLIKNFSTPAFFQVLTGASLLIRKEVFNRVGQFDEKFWNGYEDVDLCFKISREGGKLVLQPKSTLIHYESQSGKERFVANDKNILLLQKRWENKILPDVLIHENNLQERKNFKTLIPYFRRTLKDTSTSVIIVTYNSERTIVQCLTSVVNTLRSNDEIIIVDNASSDGTIEKIEKFSKKLDKIKLIRNSVNYGFAKGCNIGIQNSVKPFIVLLNPDTQVYGNWLEKLTYHFNDKSVGGVGPISNYVAGLQNYKFYYSDADTVEYQKINNIVEKQNLHGRVETKLLIGFCLVLKREIIDRIGWLDENLFLGNDDLEFSWRLRLSGYKLIISPDTFVMHIGQQSFKSLWAKDKERFLEDSTEKLYQKLIEFYGENKIPTPFNIWGIEWFTPKRPNYNKYTGIYDVKEKYRKIFHINRDDKVISIIIPVYNKIDYTIRTLASINYENDRDVEIIIINNNSTDKTNEILSSISKLNNDIRIITNTKNLGFPKAVNQGLKIAKGDFIFIANNDIILPPDWLERMIAHANKSDEIGIVGPVSNEVSGVQKVKSVGYSNLYDELTEYMEAVARKNNGQFFEFPRVAFLFTLIKRKVLEKIGGLDERFTPGNYEDDDYCLRAQLAGFKTIIALDVFVHHFGSVSFTAEGKEKYLQLLKTNEAKFIEKWGYTPDEIWLKNKTPKKGELYIPIGNEAFPLLVEEANRQINEGNLSEARDLLQKAVRNFDDRFGISYEKLDELLNKIELALAKKK